MLRIDDGELAQILDTLEPLLLDLSDVVVEVKRLQDSLMARLGFGILLLEVLEDIAYVGPMPLPVVPTLSLPF